MKTTVELPDELLMAAKAAALRRRTSLKALLIRALERELRGGNSAQSPARFRIDESGWPVLQSPGDDTGVIKDSLIDELRETEGV